MSLQNHHSIAILVASLFVSCVRSENTTQPTSSKTTNITQKPESQSIPNSQIQGFAPTEFVACYGINACRSQGDCAGDNHGCDGENQCKGKGWLKATAEDCVSKKGTIISIPKHHGDTQ